MSIDLGFDISTPLDPDTGLPDLDPLLALTVTGVQTLAEGLLRRIVTPTGALIEAGSYGFDVRSFLNDMTPSTTAVATAVRSQWLADERVYDAQVTASFDSESLRIDAMVSTADGPFRLVVAVSATTVDLLSSEAG